MRRAAPTRTVTPAAQQGNILGSGILQRATATSPDPLACRVSSVLPVVVYALFYGLTGHIWQAGLASRQTQ